MLKWENKKNDLIDKDKKNLYMYMYMHVKKFYDLFAT